MKIPLTKSTVLTISGIALGSFTSQAAIITWGPATPISTAIGNSSDVSTNGTVVEAFNAVANDQIGTATNITVNGVTFTPTTSLLDADPKNAGGNDFSTTTNGGDPTYDELVSTLEYGGGGNLVTLNVGNGLLGVNSTYEIQIWFSDTRAAQDSRVMTFGDGSGNDVLLNDAFSIGTFTADGTSQTLTLNSEGAPGPNFGQAHISAYQIRLTTAVPEPGSALLSGLAGLALLARRRRS
ncbi:MAG: PEP-CTERM sorting domain-containing protein [Verrucomicrobiaceae bacterium]